MSDGRVSIKGWRRDNLLHIETDGCIVNIRTGLHDDKDRKVTSIEIIPDENLMGQQPWKLRGHRNNRVIQLKKKLRPRPRLPSKCEMQNWKGG